MGSRRFEQLVAEFEKIDELKVGLSRREVPALARMLTVKFSHDGRAHCEIPCVASCPQRTAELILEPPAADPEVASDIEMARAVVEAHGCELSRDEVVVIVSHPDWGAFVFPIADREYSVAAAQFIALLDAIGWIEGAAMRGCACCGRELSLDEFVCRETGELLPECIHHWNQAPEESAHSRQLRREAE